MFSSRQNKHNQFYRFHYQPILLVLSSGILAVLIAAVLLMYQVTHRRLPLFSAVLPDHKSMPLLAYEQPNLRPNALILWASKAAVAAYTFNFVDHDAQIALVRPYFTSGGWQAYQDAISATVSEVVKQQLFVYGVVTKPPVISNQGYRPQKGFFWRVQIPFLATYQSAEQSRSRHYYVLMTIVKVPTSVNPAGIGIETFEMRDTSENF